MTEVNQRKMLIERKAMRFSMLGSLAFVAAEFVSFFVTGAHTILMDCIFDGMDLILIGPFMVLIPFLYRPETERLPYGYHQFECLFVVIKYSALLVVCAGTIFDNVQLILSGGHLVNAGDVAAFELAVMAGCFAVFLILRSLSRKYESEIIRSELYAWKLDTVTSCGIAIAFLVQIGIEHTGLAFLAPCVDPSVAIVLTCLLLREPVVEIRDNVKELLLFSAPKEQVDHVRGIAKEALQPYGARITFLEVVTTGRKTWIEIYIQDAEDTISLRELTKVNEAIRKGLDGYFEDFGVDLIPDIDAVPAKAKRRIRATAAGAAE